jgi:hypothetical protein
LIALSRQFPKEQEEDIQVSPLGFGVQRTLLQYGKHPHRSCFSAVLILSKPGIFVKILAHFKSA